MTQAPATQPLLATYCTLGLGGRAQHFSSPDSVEALIHDLNTAKAQQLPVLILGGGSNIVFHDEGFDGWVLRPNLQALTFEEHTPHDVRVRIGAGVPWDDVVQAAVARNLAGIEAMSGIPGHTGAAPIQNIGAYGQELSDTLRNVRAYDRQNEQIVEFTAEECAFAYRNSRFKREGTQRHVILSIELSLHRPAGPISLLYRDLTEFFGAAQAPDVQSVRDAVLAIRRGKGMVYDPADVHSHSVGSFFMNPVVPGALRTSLLSKAEAMGFGQMPQYLQEDGRWKLSAAWLISHAGVERGYRLGGAQISPRHVLAIIHAGGGTSAQVRALARHVQQRVQEVWGIKLTPEARILTRTGLDTSFYL